jgi:L-ascorbate metabolism protein UlaG (beta-lactamase superfamily)
MKIFYKLKLITIILVINLSYNSFAENMKDTPYHHLADGTFRNPEGSPKRDPNIKWSMSKWNKEKKKIKINIPSDHVVDKKEVLKNLEKYKDDDYVAWIGHATFLIKLGNTTIITDPLFSKNAGPLIFGPKRYVDPAINLKEIPEVNLFLLTHNHYDHLDYRTIKKFPYKKAKVLTPLKLGKYFTRNGFSEVQEMDWYDQTEVNDLKITLMPAVHWSKRTLTDTNKTLWGSFLIEYKNKKIFFACDTGYGNIYKDLGNKYGPIDLTFVNIGAYDFRPMFEKSIYHANPEEALNIGQDLKSKKVLGMHWGTVILSLEDPFEPPVRFKNATNKYGYHSDDAILFKIGEIQKLENLL